jgi:hypothetical protein
VNLFLENIGVFVLNSEPDVAKPETFTLLNVIIWPFSSVHWRFSAEQNWFYCKVWYVIFQFCFITLEANMTETKDDQENETTDDSRHMKNPKGSFNR